jgi:hypothetical protein
MVYSNRLYSAKAAFKSNKEPDDASFYTTNKQNAFYLQNSCRPSFNSNDLNINLFTKLDLQNVCVVNSSSTKQCTSSINPSVPFFLNYTIDPSGVLFGNSECGVSNYENYWVPNP